MSSTNPKMHQTKKDFPQSTLSNPTAHLRKSGVDFPMAYEKERPLVKNTKVNA
jgi:hypothetical protein